MKSSPCPYKLLRAMDGSQQHLEREPHRALGGFYREPRGSPCDKKIFQLPSLGSMMILGAGFRRLNVNFLSGNPLARCSFPHLTKAD